MPDNRDSGTLEDLLLEAANAAYPRLLERAGRYVDDANGIQELRDEDRKELHKPAGRQKAIAASMASILKPGRSIQVSIQDDRWLEAEALTLPRIHALQNFLLELLERGSPD